MGAIARGQAAGAGRPGGGSGASPQRREEPPHRMGVGHRVEDPPPAPATVTHQHRKPEHPLLGLMKMLLIAHSVHSLRSTTTRAAP